MLGVLLGGGLLLAGAWVAYDGLASPTARFERRMRAPSIRIADCRAGEVVKLVGVVRQLPGTPLLPSPFARRACIAWHAGIEHGAMRWSSQSQEFLLEQDDGGFARLARIEPKDADVRCPHGWWIASPTEEPYRGFAAHLHASALAPTSFAEGTIEVGMRVAVVGRVRLEQDPTAAGPGYRRLGERPVLYGEGAAVIVSSRPEHLG